MAITMEASHASDGAEVLPKEYVESRTQSYVDGLVGVLWQLGVEGFKVNNKPSNVRGSSRIVSIKKGDTTHEILFTPVSLTSKAVDVEGCGIHKVLQSPDNMKDYAEKVKQFVSQGAAKRM